MPQMSPMWWTTIFSFSIITLLITISFMYFMYNNQMKSLNKKSHENFNWKW